MSILDHLRAAYELIPSDYNGAAKHLEAALAIARRRYPELVDEIEFALSAVVNEMWGYRPRVPAKVAVGDAIELAERRIGRRAGPPEAVTGRSREAVRRRGRVIRERIRREAPPEVPPEAPLEVPPGVQEALKKLLVRKAPKKKTPGWVWALIGFAAMMILTGFRR